MKKIMLAVVFAATLVGTSSFVSAKKSQATAYAVDVTKSKIDWNGSAGDHFHQGTFAVKSGSVSVDNGKIVGGKFVIDLASVKADAGERLEGHLKSPDFFDVAKFGEATYEIKSVTYTSESAADIDGVLTLKGISGSVKFSAKVRGLDDKKLFAEATFSLDRTLFGVNYGPGKVANDVTVSVHLFAVK